MKQRLEERIELKVSHPVRLPLPGEETWVVGFALEAPPDLMDSISRVEYSLLGEPEKTRVLTDRLSSYPFLADLEIGDIQGRIISATVQMKKRRFRRRKSVSMWCPVLPPRAD